MPSFGYPLMQLRQRVGGRGVALSPEAKEKWSDINKIEICRLHGLPISRKAVDTPVSESLRVLVLTRRATL